MVFFVYLCVIVYLGDFFVVVWVVVSWVVEVVLFGKDDSSFDGVVSIVFYI